MPQFSLEGNDRTLGIESKGGVRVVFHRGAKARDAAKFNFGDPAGGAQLPARDRAVVIAKSLIPPQYQTGGVDIRPRDARHAYTEKGPLEPAHSCLFWVYGGSCAKRRSYAGGQSRR